MITQEEIIPIDTKSKVNGAMQDEAPLAPTRGKEQDIKENPLTVAEDFRSAYFYDTHNDPNPETAIRTGVMNLITSYDWIGLSAFAHDHALNPAEESFLVKKLRQTMQDKDYRALMGIARYILASTSELTPGDQSKYLPKTLHRSIAIILDALQTSLRSNTGFENKLNNKLNLRNSEISESFYETIPSILLYDFKLAARSNTHRRTYPSDPKLTGYKSETVPALLNRYGMDISSLRASLADKYRLSIQEGGPDQAETMKALAIISPDTLIDMYLTESFPEETRHEILDICADMDPELLVKMCEDGLLTYSALWDRARSIASRHPAFTIAHIDALADTSDRISEITLSCLKYGNLDEIFQELGRTGMSLQLNEKDSEEAEKALQDRLNEEYETLKSPIDRWRYIHRFEGYPFISQRTILGRIQERLYAEIYDALSPKIRELETEFLKDRADDDLDYLLDLAIKTRTVMFRTNNPNLEEYAFLHELDDASQNFLLAYSFLRYTPLADIQKIDHDELSSFIEDEYTDHQREILLEAILQHIDPKSMNGIYLINKLVKTNDTLPESLKVRVKKWIADSLIELDELEKRQDHDGTNSDSFVLNSYFDVLSNLNDPVLIDQLVNISLKHPGYLSQFICGRDIRQDAAGKLLKLLSPQDHERLLTAAKEETAFYLLMTLPSVYPDHKRELFYKLKDSGNEMLDLFDDYDEFINFEPFDNFRRTNTAISSILELRRKFGHVRWQRIARYFDFRNGVISSLDEEGFVLIEQILNMGNPQLSRLTRRYWSVFLNNDFTDMDIRFLIDTLEKLPDNLARMKNDMTKFGIDADDEIYELIPNIDPTGSLSIDTDKKAAAERLINQYAMIKWQSYKSGMTVEQIAELWSGLQGSEDSIDIEDLFLENGLWGKGLKTLYDYRESFFKALQEQQIVRSANLLEAIDPRDPERSIINVISHASTLSTSDPEWKRLADIGLDIILDGKHETNRDIYIGAEWQSATPELVKELRETAERHLESAFTITQEEKQEANNRNKRIAEQIRDHKNQFLIPHGSHTHVTSTSSLSGIMELGNLAGEFLGRISGSADGYPGYVDLQRIDETWGDDITLKDLLTHTSLFGGLAKLNAILLYLPDSIKQIMMPATAIKGHQLSSGAVSASELCLVLSNGHTEQEITDAKMSSVKSGIYVPIVDAQSFELIFSPEEFEAISKEQKRIPTIDALLEEKELYDPELYKTPNANSHLTIAEHMEKVTTYARDILDQLPLPAEIKLITLAASKLHDAGKLDTLPQEIANVEKAAKILDQVVDLNIEQRRKILMLIKHDELLGEILKGISIGSNGELIISHYSTKKIEQFNSTFTDPALKTALLVLYQADVRGIGGNEWEEWQIEQKLNGLGLPVFPLNTALSTV